MIRQCIEKKLKSKKGFSLTETLATLVIMSLVGIMITTGITTAVRVYEQVTEYARAQVLFSTAYTLINDELIYAKPDTVEVSNDGKSITFQHIKNAKETLSSDATDTEGTGIKISYKTESGTGTGVQPLVTYETNETLYTDWKIKPPDKKTKKDEISIELEYFCVKKQGVNEPLVIIENVMIKPLNG